MEGEIYRSVFSLQISFELYDKAYQTITQMPGMVYPYNLKNVFKGTPFEYCSLDYFVKNNRFVELPVVYYLKTYLKFPLLEQFVKQNMFYIALECYISFQTNGKKQRKRIQDIS